MFYQDQFELTNELLIIKGNDCPQAVDREKETLNNLVAAKKRDIKQMDDVANDLGLDRNGFREYVHERKREERRQGKKHMDYNDLREWGEDYRRETNTDDQYTPFLFNPVLGEEVPVNNETPIRFRAPIKIPIRIPILP